MLTLCFRFRSFPFRSTFFRPLLFRFRLLSLLFLPFRFLSVSASTAASSVHQFLLSLCWFSPFFQNPVSRVFFPGFRTRLSVSFLSSFPDSLPQLFLRCLPYAFAFGLFPFRSLSFVRSRPVPTTQPSVFLFPSSRFPLAAVPSVLVSSSVRPVAMPSFRFRYSAFCNSFFRPLFRFTEATTAPRPLRSISLGFRFRFRLLSHLALFSESFVRSSTLRVRSELVYITTPFSICQHFFQKNLIFLKNFLSNIKRQKKSLIRTFRLFLLNDFISASVHKKRFRFPCFPPRFFLCAP